MKKKIYYSAEDIAGMLGVSTGKAYKILREMNKDLVIEVFSQLPVKFRWSISKKGGTGRRRR